MARTKSILLLTGDYADRLNTLWAAAQAALEDKSQRTLAEADPYEALATEYADLKAEAEAAGLRVTLQDPGRKVWRELKVKHPPRTGEGIDPEIVKADRAAGINQDAAEDDLVYACLVEPEFTSRGAFDEWADQLGEGEFQTILIAAWNLVNVAQYDPKSLPPSPNRGNGEN
jgi:hypothetical protein